MTRLKVLLAAASASAALALSGPESSAAPLPATGQQARAGAGGAAQAVVSTLLAPGYDWQRYGVYDARRGTWNLISRGTPTLIPQGEGC